MRQGVYVVILNWNGWCDTIECLESVLRSDYKDYRVVVCDNGSSDSSLERIANWATGGATRQPDPATPLRRLSHPPVDKPVLYREYTRKQAEACAVSGAVTADDSPLVLIRIDENLGYAGGNNVGLRFALSQPECAYVWLLNNDTVVEPDAMSALVRRLEGEPEAGQCGSTLLYYDDPQRVQALGGARYSPWFGTIRHIQPNGDPLRYPTPEVVQRKMSYVVGASLLARRGFIEAVGPLREDYFLYCEELDWALRGSDRFALAYAPESRVYHKEGATLGSSPVAHRRSRAADYFMIRNRIVITLRFFPWLLPVAVAGAAVSLLNRVRRRQWDRLSLVCGAVRDALRGRLGPARAGTRVRLDRAAGLAERNGE